MGAKVELLKLSLVKAHVETRFGKLINVKEYNNRIVRHIGLASSTLGDRLFKSPQGSSEHKALGTANNHLMLAHAHAIRGEHGSVTTHLQGAREALSKSPDAEHHLKAETEDGASVGNHLEAAHKAASAVQTATAHDRLLASQNQSAIAHKATAKAESHPTVINHQHAELEHTDAEMKARDAGRDAAAHNHNRMAVNHRMAAGSAVGKLIKKPEAEKPAGNANALKQKLAAQKSSDAEAATKKAYDLGSIKNTHLPDLSEVAKAHTKAAEANEAAQKANSDAGLHDKAARHAFQAGAHRDNAKAAAAGAPIQKARAAEAARLKKDGPAHG